MEHSGVRIVTSPTETPQPEGPHPPELLRQTLADFQRRALELLPDEILQIVLYGSYARGEATGDSDVDVMVVMKRTDAGDGFYPPESESRRWEDRIGDAASRALDRHGVDLTTLVMSEREFNARTPLARDVRREGVVVWRREGWTVSTEEEVPPADPYDPQTWLDLARGKLDHARQNFDIGIYSAAVSLAYYSIFYACRAALLTKGMYLKKHSAAQAKFSEHFVKTGEVEERFTQYLRLGKEAREKSDYEPYFPVKREEAAPKLSAAEEFITKMEELVGAKPLSS